MPDFRQIPSIEQLRQRDGLRRLEAEFGRENVVAALRAEAAAVRDRMSSGDLPADIAQAIEQAIPARLRRTMSASLVSVINATGVIVHTNLGRAPLAPAAARRVVEIATGYSNLEYDLERGARGRRDAHAEQLICRLTGGAAAVVVNNNAAATLLALSALARGREVIISRGELVEIGGGFRVPDVMAQSGARLREVGSTNRTRASDYAAAISDATALILRVHPSNFRMEGFTERPALADLVTLGRRFSIPVIEDLGSGYLRVPADIGALRDEPAVQASIDSGADLVMFSGDKLLGGPQAGILAGTIDLVGQLRRHPLMRALRVDKMTYAALEATLQMYAAGQALDTVPVARMMGLPLDAIEARARALIERLADAGVAAVLEPGHSTIGGGSAPGSALPTWLVALPDAPAERLERGLRGQQPPVIARIERDRVVLDLRTVPPEADALVGDCVVAAATHFP